MGQVALTIMGRTYTLRCTDGEEARLVGLAGYVKDRADALADEFRSAAGPISDDRLLLLVALSLADELWEAREASANPATALVNGAHAPSAPASLAPSSLARPQPNGRVAR